MDFSKPQDIPIEGRKYTSFDVVRLLGVKRVTLQDWMARGFIVPDIKADGRGTKNYFSRWNLYQISLFAYLIEHGLSREEAARRVMEIRMKWHHAKIEKAVEKVTSGKLEASNPRFVQITRMGDQYEAAVLNEKAGSVQITVESEIDEVQLVNIQKIMKQVDRAIRA